MTSIWDLKANPWSDEPRYYPPGQHPATAQMQAELALLEALPPASDVDACIAHIREQLAQFEQRESELKARHDWVLRHTPQ